MRVVAAAYKTDCLESSELLQVKNQSSDFARLDAYLRQ